MTDQTGLMARMRRHRPPARHRALRWALAGVVALVALVVAAVAVFIEQPAAPRLTLPTSVASPPSGLIGGTWQVAAGSVAGFRVAESALGFSNDTVGRTTAVNGTVIVSGDRVTGGSIRIAVTGIKVGGKAAPQLASSLDTGRFPVATFVLTRPVTLGAAFVSGSAVTITAVGALTMDGTTHMVQVRISARRDGLVLQAAGSIRVPFPAWGIKRPSGFGFFGSLADQGTAEFLLILHPE